MIVVSYIIKFKNSRSVTPGTPPIAEVSTDSRLTGIYTPVSGESKSTAAREPSPIHIDKSALLKGRLFFSAK